MKLKVYSAKSISLRHFNPKVSNRLFTLFSASKKEDVDLANVVQLTPKIKHLIFNLQDVLYSGTQKNGISKEIPFTQTINVFVSDQHIYIENKGNGYTEIIKKHITEKYNFVLEELLIQNNFFVKVKNQLDIRILDIYFEDRFGDKLGELELLNEFDITNLPNDTHIHSITFQPLKLSKGFITILHDGEMVLKLSSTEEFTEWLLFFDKEVTDA